ncbi:metallophosphatase [Floricoccus tropicus]|uniref:Metallophosphatase n=1 Tax=Floricoccus tropicus TaxID=1859473 RepID=A0A1E8GQL9_9LACT|nr:CapA family protein [Floricoccus tropicus]OFI50541.1 metallophosphatase [Floricoccus tropicus]
MNENGKINWKRLTILVLLGILLPICFVYAQGRLFNKNKVTPENKEKIENKKTSKEKGSSKKTAKITASGDMLYHDIVYGSAWDGQRYDFDNDYELVKPLVSSADLALGDFEGTINPNRELAGYPIFNAPEEVLGSIKSAGFDVLDLGHNHILDTGIDGLVYTANAIKKAGMDYIGVDVNNRGILVKEVNGIKIALLSYAYGFNGLEEGISKEDYDKYLKDMNPDKMKKEIEEAEKIADITVIMPQMGEEYRLTPTDDQIKTYHDMIDWGADIIFGGHPHVAEPTEIVEKDGERKFIIYSMGNLLSNQRYETLEDYWTERGVIMDVDIEKENDKTVIKNVKAHPTWVSRTPIEGRTFQGFPAYDYQVLLAENYIKGGKLADTVPEETRQRIETAYNEMMTLLNLQWN